MYHFPVLCRRISLWLIQADRERLLLASLGDLQDNQMNGVVSKLKVLLKQL